jgi:hypothetical protein
MHSLRIAVIVMAVLIVIGLTVVVVTIASRLGGGGNDVAATGFGEIALPIAAGARIADVAIDGGKLVLLVEDGNGGQEVVVIDLSSGRELGRLAAPR